MTIELITGTPGAGKTTFAVAERLAKEVGRKITLDDDTCLKMGLDPGHQVERRLVCAGVRGLKLEHERLPHILTRDASSPAEVLKWNAMVKGADGKETEEPVHQRFAGDPPVDVPAIVQNWWLWCKPGDLIVIDESQFIAPRGTLGRSPPFWIQCLEIHRHYGVDFIFITQHPGLIDTTIRHLVGMHRHVRSVMGSAVCMVYTWDHASNPERYTNSNKSQFIRRKKHYALFHSSAAHVKPPTSGRSVLVVVPMLLVVVGVGFFHFKQRFSPEGAKHEAIAKGPIGTAVAATLPHAAVPALNKPQGYADVPDLSGCWAVGDACSCLATSGRVVRIDMHMCKVTSSSYEGLVQWAPQQSAWDNRPASAAPAASSALASQPVALLAGS